MARLRAIDEDEDILNEKVVPEDRTKRLFKCKHGLAVTWKQARRLVETVFDPKAVRQIRQSRGCLYLLVLSEEEARVAFKLGKAMPKEA